MGKLPFSFALCLSPRYAVHEEKEFNKGKKLTEHFMNPLLKGYNKKIWFCKAPVF